MKDKKIDMIVDLLLSYHHNIGYNLAIVCKNLQRVKQTKSYLEKEYVLTQRCEQVSQFIYKYSENRLQILSYEALNARGFRCHLMLWDNEIDDDDYFKEIAIPMCNAGGLSRPEIINLKELISKSPKEVKGYEDFQIEI
jgi:hypothetical protein